MDTVRSEPLRGARSDTGRIEPVWFRSAQAQPLECCAPARATFQWKPQPSQGQTAHGAGGVAGLFGRVRLAFVATYVEQEARDTKTASKWEKMRQGLRQNLRRW